MKEKNVDQLIREKSSIEEQLKKIKSNSNPSEYQKSVVEDMERELAKIDKKLS